MASTTREALIKSLKGQKIRIYDLDKVMSGWPSIVNPNVDTLRQDVQARITGYAPPSFSSRINDIACEAYLTSSQTVHR